MLVFLIILGVCLLFGVGFLLVVVASREQSRAKRRAREMLERGGLCGTNLYTGFIPTLCTPAL